MTSIHHGLGLIGPGGVGTGSTDKTQAAQDQSFSPQASPVPGSSEESGAVAITSTAQLLANVAQQLADAPDANQSRIDSLREALNNGTYKIDSGRVADGLLAAQKLDAQASTPNSGPQAATARAFAATAQLGSDPN